MRARHANEGQSDIARSALASMTPASVISIKRDGVLSSRQIQSMADAGQIRLAAPLAHGQIQPADLVLGAELAGQFNSVRSANFVDCAGKRVAAYNEFT